MSEPTIPKPGDLWRDHQGNLYEVIGVATDVELGRQHVVYKSESGHLYTMLEGRWAILITRKGGASVQKFTLACRPAGPDEERPPHEDSQPFPGLCLPVETTDGTEVVYA